MSTMVARIPLALCALAAALALALLCASPALALLPPLRITANINAGFSATFTQALQAYQVSRSTSVAPQQPYAPPPPSSHPFFPLCALAFRLYHSWIIRSCSVMVRCKHAHREPATVCKGGFRKIRCARNPTLTPVCLLRDVRLFALARTRRLVLQPPRCCVLVFFCCFCCGSHDLLDSLRSGGWRGGDELWQL